jgi:hypothetical protein
MKDIRYNHYEIKKKVEWFESIFKKEMNKERWGIYECRLPYNKQAFIDYVQIYVICPLKINKKQMITFSRYSLPNVLRIVKQYGWKLEGNMLLDFDINKLKRNKHLLTGTELGLL